MVGRTASGKTTVSRLLPRFYDVTGGRSTVDGHDVRDITLASLRSQIGVVLDEPFLFTASIRDNIAYGRPDAPIDEIRGRRSRRRAPTEFIRGLPDGYDTVVGERGYTLSGGQRQRIAIARTLLVNPPILDPRRRHQRRRRPGRAGDPRGAAGADGGAHDADRRPPALDDRAGRPGRAARRAAGSSPTAPMPSCWRRRRCTSRCWLRSRRPSARAARRRHGARDRRARLRPMPDGRRREAAP